MRQVNTKSRWVRDQVKSANGKPIDSFIIGVLYAMEETGRANVIYREPEEHPTTIVFERRPNLRIKRAR